MSGNNYTIEYLENGIKEDIPSLPKHAKKQLQKAIQERLTNDPIGFGKPLRYSLRGHRRLRVGDYRVVYRIENENNIVLIIAVKHRRDIYEEF